MEQLIKWLKTEGIYVNFVDMEEVGLCVTNRNIILISSKYKESIQLKGIRHELKHFDHKDYVLLYDKFIYHSKMENEAEQNVVRESLNDYIIELDGEIEKVNYLNFLEIYELDLNHTPYVIKLLEEMKGSPVEKALNSIENFIGFNEYAY